MSKKLYDIEDCIIRQETKLAVGFVCPAHEDEDDLVWVPRSVAEIEHHRGGTCTITIPEHMAKDKGLV